MAGLEAADADAWAACCSGHPRVAPAWLVYLSVAVVEAVLLVGYGWALRWVWTELGPGRRAGLATRAQAAAVLGVGRLQRVRHLIRPDLYGPTPPAPAVDVAARVDDAPAGRTTDVIRLGSRFGAGGAVR